MRKNSIKILIAVLSLFSLISFAFACAPQQPGHVHQYSEKYCFDKEYHWFECECGEDKQKELHDFINEECKCGFKKEYASEDHIHAYINKGFDKQKHWYECVCGVKYGAENHSGGIATCTKKAICEKCENEYGEFAQHVYGEDAIFDDYKHWYECACGDKFGDEKHSGGTATCTKKATCEKCESEYGELAQHEYGKGLVYDDYNHWVECKCGEKKDVQAHELVNYTCECGYTMLSDKTAPNYSDNTQTFDTWAFGMVMSDWYMLNGEKYYLEDGIFQTKDKTQALKDANFTTVYIDYSFDDFNFINGIAGTKFEKVVRDCEELGLDTIWFGKELRTLSCRYESLINQQRWEGIEQGYISRWQAEFGISGDKSLEQYIFENVNYNSLYFESQEQLNRCVAWLLRETKNYSSFIGVALVDEPNYRYFQAIREVIIALQAFDPDIYIMLNMLPMLTNSAIHNLYCENGRELGMEAAYKEYLRLYYEYFGDLLDYFMYDDQPVKTDGISTTHIRTQQIVSDFCKEHGLKRKIVMQSIEFSVYRLPDMDDMLWQANVSMAFGNSEFSYYTYLPNVNSSGSSVPDGAKFPMTWEGEKNPLWYHIQSVNEEIRYNSKYLQDFRYKGVTWLRTESYPPMGYFGYVEKNEMSQLSSFSFVERNDEQGLVLITEMYDEERGQWGYYVVNATDSVLDEGKITVSLTFNNYENVSVVQSRENVNFKLRNNEITITLGVGEGAFIMPY